MLWCLTVLHTDQSFPRPTDVAKDDSKVNESPSDCDRKTQMEDVQGFVKEPLEEDNNKEDEKALPSPFHNETDFWLFIYRSCVFTCMITNEIDSLTYYWYCASS